MNEYFNPYCDSFTIHMTRDTGIMKLRGPPAQLSHYKDLNIHQPLITRSKSQYKDLNIPFSIAAKEACHQLVLMLICYHFLNKYTICITNKHTQLKTLQDKKLQKQN
jgi:hypothetical protein